MQSSATKDHTKDSTSSRRAKTALPLSAASSGKCGPTAAEHFDSGACPRLTYEHVTRDKRTYSRMGPAFNSGVENSGANVWLRSSVAESQSVSNLRREPGGSGSIQQIGRVAPNLPDWLRGGSTRARMEVFMARSQRVHSPARRRTRESSHDSPKSSSRITERV
jgi:hypothetical protein